MSTFDPFPPAFTIQHQKVFTLNHHPPATTTHPLSRSTRIHCPSANGPLVITFHTVTVSTTLEATLGQIDGFFSQLPYKCHQNRVASEED